MKKIIIILLLSLVFISCTDSNPKTLDINDSIGDDSSAILPPLIIDSIISGPKDTLLGTDITKPVQ